MAKKIKSDSNVQGAAESEVKTSQKPEERVIVENDLALTEEPKDIEPAIEEEIKPEPEQIPNEDLPSLDEIKAKERALRKR